MSDVMLHGVLNMPLPDDPTECDLVTWVQFKDRARQASSRIKELEAQIKEDALQYLSDIGQMCDRIEELEAKLAKAKHTLRCVDRRMNDLGGYDGRFSLRKIVSITLAELTGGKDE